MQLNITELVAARVGAKRAEDAAIAARREIDEALVAALGRPDAGDEGTVSSPAGDLKVSVTYGLTRKVDVEAIRRDWYALPAPVQNAIRWKAEVSVAEMRKLPGGDAFQLSKYVTATPSTPSVKVELARGAA